MNSARFGLLSVDKRPTRECFCVIIAGDLKGRKSPASLNMEGVFFLTYPVSCGIILRIFSYPDPHGVFSQGVETKV